MAPLDKAALLERLPLLLPLAYLLAAWATPPARPFRGVVAVAWAGLGLALLHPPLHWLALGAPVDPVPALMLILVSGLTLVIARYSRTYLRGEPGQRRYTRALLATAAAVTTLVLTDALPILAGAWMATSFCVHQALTFYPEREAARIAAHKKFIVARLADLGLIGAVACLGASGIWTLSALNALATSGAPLPILVHLAMVLLTLTVLLRSAQLPFHGWMIQVMEAPTPVSALLHAGIVNLGGFVLIRLGPALLEAPVARGLLFITGLGTAVVGALIMTTRVSVKVALAWSTISQMGLLLVQCAVGAWHLAMLHLLAHSLYKAHAFLSAGSTVEGWSARTLRPTPVPTGARLGRATFGALLLVLALGAGLLAQGGAIEPSAAALAVIFGLSLVPFWVHSAPRGLTAALGVAAASLAIALVYSVVHLVFGALLGSAEGNDAALLWGLLLGLGGLFLVQSILWVRPEGGLARWLHPRLFCAFHLDEWFTRIAFRAWPPPVPDGPKPTQTKLRATEELPSC